MSEVRSTGKFRKTPSFRTRVFAAWVRFYLTRRLRFLRVRHAKTVFTRQQSQSLSGLGELQQVVV